MAPVGGSRSKKRPSAFDLYQKTVMVDMQNKFGGPDALNDAMASRLASRFEPRPTTVGFNRVRRLLYHERAGARERALRHSSE